MYKIDSREGGGVQNSVTRTDPACLKNWKLSALTEMNQLVFSQFSKLMKVKMEVADLLSEIVILIRIDDHIKMLNNFIQY